MKNIIIDESVSQKQFKKVIKYLKTNDVSLIDIIDIKEIKNKILIGSCFYFLTS